MKTFFLSCVVYFLFIASAHPKEVIQARVAVLPWSLEISTGLTSRQIEEQFKALVLKDPRFALVQTNRTSSPSAFNSLRLLKVNSQIVSEISKETKADFFISGRVIQHTQGYWVLIQAYKALNGELVFSRKKGFINLPTDLAQEMYSFLSFLDRPNTKHFIKDFGPMGQASGELHLQSTPSEVIVSLNGKEMGITPLIVRYIPEGEYLLSFQENQKLQELKIEVSSAPSDKKVYLKGILIGKTPLKHSLKHAGKFDLKLDGQNTKVDLSFLSSPANLKVKINQKSIQRTPINYSSLEPRSIDFEISPPGLLVRKKIKVSENVNDYKVDLYKKSQIYIQSSHTPSTLFLDHEQVGETPYSLSLAQGYHQLRLRKRRFKIKDLDLDLKAGQRHIYKVNLFPKSSNTAIFLVPTGNIMANYGLSINYLGFSQTQSDQNQIAEDVHFAYAELDYGWPELYQSYSIFDFGLSVSGFGGVLGNLQSQVSSLGAGGKLQFLRESDSMPISAALGTYVSFSEKVAWVSFISLSRHFLDYALHLGLQTHGISLGVDYTGFEHAQIGFSLFSDALGGVFTLNGQSINTIYGLRGSYHF